MLGWGRKDTSTREAWGPIGAGGRGGKRGSACTSQGVQDICGGDIHPERLGVNPRIVTCGRECASELRRHLQRGLPSNATGIATHRSPAPAMPPTPAMPPEADVSHVRELARAW